MFNYYLDAFRVNYANFEGRARRSEYWYFLLFHLIAVIVLAVLGGAFSSAAGGESSFLGLIPYFIYILASILPSISIAVRRLHDVGKSGWFIFIGLIPIIGSIWLLVLYCTEGERGPNAYGDDPKNPELNGSEDNDVSTIGQNLNG